VKLVQPQTESCIHCSPASRNTSQATPIAMRSRLYGFPCFPCSVISMACFRSTNAGKNRAQYAALATRCPSVLIASQLAIDHQLTCVERRPNYLYWRRPHFAETDACLVGPPPESPIEDLLGRSAFAGLKEHRRHFNRLPITTRGTASYPRCS